MRELTAEVDTYKNIFIAYKYYSLKIYQAYKNIFKQLYKSIFCIQKSHI